MCSCCQPRIDPSVRVRRRSSAHTVRHATADGAGGSWSASGRWTAGGLAEPLWRDAPRSDDESLSDDSEDDANSSIAERLQKVAKRRSKARKREKRRERRSAAATIQTHSRARRQSEAVVPQARVSTQRRASAPANAPRSNPSDSKLYCSIAAALHLPKTDAPQALILDACQQLGIPLGSSDELYENPVAMATATQEVLRALGLSMDKRGKPSAGRQTAAAAKLDETVPAWRVGAVDVLNMQRQPVAAQEPRRQRRRSRGHIQ
eukprot:COSAG02_NODE_6962_length_3261_cov_8.559140_2_plen_263_part_00